MAGIIHLIESGGMTMALCGLKKTIGQNTMILNEVFF